MPEKEKVKIIDSLWAFLVATACVGPFALPLLWRNPRYSKTTKVLASLAVIIFTLLLTYGAKLILGNLVEQYEQIIQNAPQP